MERVNRLFASALVAAFILGGVVAQSAVAQDKAIAEKGQATIKTVAENDKVRAYETWYKPGDINVSIPTSSLRVVRALHGGTLLRTYADGKTEKVEWKTGEVKIIPAVGQYTVKNIGKTELVFYSVVLK